MTIVALRSSRARWFAASALYVGVTLLYAHPMLGVIGSALPNDTGDPGLNAWILWWNAHAVPLTAHWWNGPIFYPAPGAMALSETFLNLVPLSTPLQWAGASAVLTYNLLFLLSFPAAALAAHALGAPADRAARAGLVAGLAFGFSPYRAAQMPHLQTLWSCWMPLGLAGAAPVRRAPAARPRAARPVLADERAGDRVFPLLFFAVLVGLWILWFVRRWRDLLAIGVTLRHRVAAIRSAARRVSAISKRLRTRAERRRDRDVQRRPQRDLGDDRRDRLASVDDTIPGRKGSCTRASSSSRWRWSAPIVAWRRSRRLDDAGRRRSRASTRSSHGCSRLAGVFHRRDRRRPGWQGGWSSTRLRSSRFRSGGRRTPPTRRCWVLTLALVWNRRIVAAWRRRSPLFFYGVASVVMLLCALGPDARLNGVVFLDDIHTPYYWLMQLPGGHAFRVPARFATLFVLGLSIAGALAFRALTIAAARGPGSSRPRPP